MLWTSMPCTNKKLHTQPTNNLILNKWQVARVHCPNTILRKWPFIVDWLTKTKLWFIVKTSSYQQSLAMGLRLRSELLTPLWLILVGCQTLDQFKDHPRSPPTSWSQYKHNNTMKHKNTNCTHSHTFKNNKLHRYQIFSHPRFSQSKRVTYFKSIFISTQAMCHQSAKKQSTSNWIHTPFTTTKYPRNTITNYTYG